MVSQDTTAFLIQSFYLFLQAMESNWVTQWVVDWFVTTKTEQELIDYVTEYRSMPVRNVFSQDPHDFAKVQLQIECTIAPPQDDPAMFFAEQVWWFANSGWFLFSWSLLA
jgi:hypothetical protein